jgi:hypothetical protein
MTKYQPAHLLRLLQCDFDQEPDCFRAARLWRLFCDPRIQRSEKGIMSADHNADVSAGLISAHWALPRAFKRRRRGIPAASPSSKLCRYGSTFSCRPNAFERAIQSGIGAPSRCLPPAHAAAQAATAPSNTAVAIEKARIMLLRRDLAIAVLALPSALSTRRSESTGDRPVSAPTCCIR